MNMMDQAHNAFWTALYATGAIGLVFASFSMVLALLLGARGLIAVWRRVSVETKREELMRKSNVEYLRDKKGTDGLVGYHKLDNDGEPSVISLSKRGVMPNSPFTPDDAA